MNFWAKHYARALELESYGPYAHFCIGGFALQGMPHDGREGKPFAIAAYVRAG